MLLAKKGYRVLMVDRANFPSDTLSTHQIQLKGGAALKRWGLLDQVISTNCPPAHQALFDLGWVTIHGKYPPLEGVDAIISPRRTVLDKILVDAAVQAGAELRQDLVVEDLIFDGEQVTGIRARKKAKSAGGDVQVSEKARLIIGADGKHSLVARRVQAPEYNHKPVLSCAYYTYWEGLQGLGGELYSLPANLVGVWPTNDNLSVIYTAYPITEFPSIREDIEGRFWKLIAMLPRLNERLRSGRQAERFFGTADLPGFYRRPYGPGWALVGDAGLSLDPITGQGIGNAFVDAERLVKAIDDGFSGVIPIEKAMAEYERLRNQETFPRYEFTSQLASFSTNDLEQQVLFDALAKNPQAADNFFGAISGSVPFEEYFSTAHLIRIIGLAGTVRILLNRLTGSRR
jgi:2-polyprenyl-6-methoxyphenol hydroxylase-like FAD-dependent oxidoreductase